MESRPRRIAEGMGWGKSEVVALSRQNVSFWIPAGMPLAEGMVLIPGLNISPAHRLSSIRSVGAVDIFGPWRHRRYLVTGFPPALKLAFSVDPRTSRGIASAYPRPY